jgi:cytochrome c553
MKRNITNVRWKLAMAMSAMAVVAAIMMKTSVSANAPAAVQADMVKRGDYLVNTMGCGDCHTPYKMGPNGPEPDMSLFLSGHPESMKLPPPPPPSGPWIASIAATMTAWAGPWGVSYTANLTPDKETGISGTYTEEQFIMAIREGKKQGRGRGLLPPMPWPVIRNLTDDDLKAIFAYLKTIKPVRNKVPEPVIAEMK